jgi:SRSO17 transposase
MLLRVCQWVVPAMDFSDGGWWIIDDTGFPKQGRHSVGVARQYRGMLGKQDNCQVAVSVTLACQAGSLPVAWRLYLPKEWADDVPRRDKAGVPQGVEFATKPATALAQIEHLMSQGAPKHCVLADAGYGVDTAFRERLSELGLTYVVGVTGQVTVWPPGPRTAAARAVQRSRCGAHAPAFGRCGAAAPTVDQGTGVRAGALAMADTRMARRHQLHAALALRPGSRARGPSRPQAHADAS